MFGRRLSWGVVLCGVAACEAQLVSSSTELSPNDEGEGGQSGVETAGAHTLRARRTGRAIRRTPRSRSGPRQGSRSRLQDGGGGSGANAPGGDGGSEDGGARGELGGGAGELGGGAGELGGGAGELGGEAGEQGASGAASTGGAGAGPSVPQHGCVTFVDRTPVESPRTILWNFDLGPERCMTVRVGQSVTWSGLFLRHPLAPLGTSSPPISPSSPNREMHTVTFPSAGIFGYICLAHTEMRGAIQVVP